MKPVQALIWECWRLSRPEFFLTVVCVAFFCVLYQTLSGTMDGDQRELVAIVFATLIGALSVISFTWTRVFIPQDGFPFAHHFTKPVSTQMLVTVCWLFVVTKSSLTALASWFVFWLVSGYPLPLLPATLVVAFVAGALASVSWAIVSIIARRALVLLILILVSAFLGSYIGHLHSQPNEFLGWPFIKWSFFMSGGVGLMGSIPLVVRRVELQRHRLGQPQTSLRELYLRMGNEQAQIMPARLVNQFRTPFRSLVSFESRVLGTRMIFWVIAINAILMFLLSLSTMIDYRPRFSFWFPYAISVSCICLLLFGVINSAQSFNTRSIPIFQGARPVTDQQIAFAKLLALLLQLYIGCLIAVAFIAAFWFLHVNRSVDVLQEMSGLHQFLANPGWKQSWLIVPMLLIAVSAAGVLCFAWIPYGFRYGGAMSACLFLLLVYCAGIGWDAENGWRYKEWWIGSGILLTTLLAVCVANEAWKTISQKLIDYRWTALILGIWIVALGLIFAIFNNGSPQFLEQLTAIQCLGIVAGTWVPTGLAISLPWIVGRLRHQ